MASTAERQWEREYFGENISVLEEWRDDTDGTVS